MDFSVAQTAQPFAILPSSISRTFNCTSKTTGWFTKGLNDPNLPHANKVLLKVHTLYMMDFFQSPLCPSRCYLTFFHFPERSIASKRLAGSPG
jgi:hypothetical protein